MRLQFHLSLEPYRNQHSKNKNHKTQSSTLQNTFQKITLKISRPIMLHFLDQNNFYFSEYFNELYLIIYFLYIRHLQFINISKLQLIIVLNCQITMFLFKIGKTKHKFKLKFTIAKFDYEPIQNLDRHSLYKIKVTRGSHSTQIISLPVRKNIIKFPKTEYTIPVTLFFDQDDKTYLQKQAQIKAYVCDQNGQHKRAIGKTQLNIAQYANNGKFALQVQVQGQQKKYSEKVMIVFHMFMQRQDNDSKSVNTYSDQQSQKNAIQSKEQNKIKNNLLLKPNGKNSKTVKSVQDQRQKVEKISEQQSNNSVQIQRSRLKSFQKTQEKVQKQKKKPKRTQASEDEQNQPFFYNKLKEQTDKQKLVEKQKKKQNQAKIQKNTVAERQSSNKLKQQQQQGGSLQFKLYIANKKISDLEGQNSNLKKKNDQLKKMVDKVVEQSEQKKINNQKDQYSQQIQYYKKIIIEKQIKLSQLQGSKKNIQGRQNQNEKMIMQLKTQLKNSKLRLQFQKNKVARIMQKILEYGDTEMIAMIQSEIQDQYF